jgi:hypothetical protein
LKYSHYVCLDSCQVALVIEKRYEDRYLKISHRRDRCAVIIIGLDVRIRRCEDEAVRDRARRWEAEYLIKRVIY